MERKTYIGSDNLSLVEYLSEDDMDSYNNWLDPETQRSYNFAFTDTFEDYAKKVIKQRFLASIMLIKTELIVGTIGLSPEGSTPDLAIWIYKPYRNKGYGTKAFSLGIRYCFDTLKLDKIHAGCYPHNSASKKMLMKCGFIPNPSGNIDEKHYLTGEPIIQYDYILHGPK